MKIQENGYIMNHFDPSKKLSEPVELKSNMENSNLKGLQ